MSAMTSKRRGFRIPPVVASVLLLLAMVAFGSVIGALIIQTLTYAIYSLGVPPEINLVVKAVVVFAVMLLQSAEFRGQLRRIAFRAAPGAPQ